MGCGCGCGEAKIANGHSLVVNNLALNQLLPSAETGRDTIDEEYGSDGSALQVTVTVPENRCYAYDAWVKNFYRAVWTTLEYEQFGYAGVALAMAVGTAIALFGFATGGIGLGLALGLGIATLGGIGGTLTTTQKIDILKAYTDAEALICHLLAEMPSNTPTIDDLQTSIASFSPSGANGQYVKDLFSARADEKYGHYALLVWLGFAVDENLQKDCGCDEETPYWAVSTPGIDIVSDTLGTLIFDIVGAPKGITRRLIPSDDLALVVINSISASGALGIDVIKDGALFYSGVASGLNALCPFEGTVSIDFYNDVRVTLEYENFS